MSGPARRALEERRVQDFLIVGFHADTRQRYAQTVRARTADAAERAFRRPCSDLVIVGVVGIDPKTGSLAALDTAERIS